MGSVLPHRRDLETAARQEGRRFTNCGELSASISRRFAAACGLPANGIRTDYPARWMAAVAQLAHDSHARTATSKARQRSHISLRDML
jgi:hypothetical protein